MFKYNTRFSFDVSAMKKRFNEMKLTFKVGYFKEDSPTRDDTHKTNYEIAVYQNEFANHKRPFIDEFKKKTDVFAGMIKSTYASILKSNSSKEVEIVASRLNNLFKKSIISSEWAPLSKTTVLKRIEKRKYRRKAGLPNSSYPLEKPLVDTTQLLRASRFKVYKGKRLIAKGGAS